MPTGLDLASAIAGIRAQLCGRGFVQDQGGIGMFLKDRRRAKVAHWSFNRIFHGPCLALILNGADYRFRSHDLPNAHGQSFGGNIGHGVKPALVDLLSAAGLIQ